MNERKGVRRGAGDVSAAGVLTVDRHTYVLIDEVLGLKQGVGECHIILRGGSEIVTKAWNASEFAPILDFALGRLHRANPRLYVQGIEDGADDGEPAMSETKGTPPDPGIVREVTRTEAPDNDMAAALRRVLEYWDGDWGADWYTVQQAMRKQVVDALVKPEGWRA